MTLPPKLDLSCKMRNCMIYWYSIISQRNCCHFYFCNIVSIETHYRRHLFSACSNINSLKVAASARVWLKRTVFYIFSTAHHSFEYRNVHWLCVETELLTSFSLWAQPAVDPVHLCSSSCGCWRSQRSFRPATVFWMISTPFLQLRFYSLSLYSFYYIPVLLSYFYI